MDAAFILTLSKVLAAFVVMLGGLRLKLPIGPAILLGSLVMGFLFGLGPLQWLLAGIKAVLSLESLLFLAIVALIMVLSNLLEQTGQGMRIMQAISRYLYWPKLRLVFFPALIGLLPMPGGAVFSAPMVKSASAGFDIRAQKLALLNYWFRHIWELVWPLYPGFILAVHLGEVSVNELLFKTWPSIFICLLLGWFFFLRPGELRPSKSKEDIPSLNQTGSVLRESLPLITAVLGTLSLEALISHLSLELPLEAGFLLALFLSILICIFQNRLAPSNILKPFKQKHLYQMLLALVAIFVFKAVLDKTDVAGSLAQGSGNSAALFFVSIFLPLLVGLIAGLTLAFVGSTFPLILGIAQHLGLQDITPYLVLALFAGYAGVLGSPLHICLLLTCEYFQVGLFSVWKRLALPCLIFLLLGAFYSWFLILV
jgi:integral membrane protein (TIGR00529 family)